VPSFTHLGCFKVFKTSGELLKSAHHFLVHDFLDFCCNSYDLAKFNEVATFHSLCAQKSAKIPDMFKGQKYSLSCLKEHMEPHVWFW
jgi:hypothetical protein